MDALPIFGVVVLLATAVVLIYIVLHNDRVRVQHATIQARAPQDLEAAKGASWPEVSKEDLARPPDVTVLGRSAWTLIHTMAVRYPDSPSGEDKRKMNAFLAALSEFYPCGLCASHLQSYLRDHPADVSSRNALRQWLCDLHNSVNKKLKKPAFNCELVDNRWGGPPSNYVNPLKKVALTTDEQQDKKGCGSGFCTRR